MPKQAARHPFALRSIKKIPDRSKRQQRAVYWVDRARAGDRRAPVVLKRFYSDILTYIEPEKQEG